MLRSEQGVAAVGEEGPRWRVVLFKSILFTEQPV